MPVRFMKKPAENMLMLRIDSPMRSAVSSCKQKTPENDWTNTGQNLSRLVATDPNLAKIIEAWSLLSDELRKAILKMIS